LEHRAATILRCTNTLDLGVLEVERGVASVEALETPILTCQTTSPTARGSREASDQVEATKMKRIRNIKLHQNFSCHNFQISKLTEQ
jgi:hypothetical protein